MSSSAKARYADENGNGEDAEITDPMFTHGISDDPRPHVTVTESARSRRRGRFADEHHQKVGVGSGGVAPVLSVQGPLEEEGGIAGPRASEEQWPHVEAIQKIVSHPPPFPPWMHHDAGIVMSAGTAMEIAEACVSISALRSRGCALPVEIFYTGKSKLDANVEQRLKSADHATVLIDMLRMPGMDSNRELDGRQMQAFAILHSSFVEVVWMDRRIHPMLDLREIFDDESYLEHGCLFWQDLVTDSHWLELSWSEQYAMEMGIEDMDMGDREFEAGMLVVDKERCWVALQLVVYMSLESAHFDHFDGMTNVDSWRLTFKLLGARYGPISYLPDFVDELGSFSWNNLLYKSTDGKAVFLRKILQQSLAVDIPTPCNETNATCI